VALEYLTSKIKTQLRTQADNKKTKKKYITKCKINKKSCKLTKTRQAHYVPFAKAQMAMANVF